MKASFCSLVILKSSSSRPAFETACPAMYTLRSIVKILSKAHPHAFETMFSTKDRTSLSSSCDYTCWIRISYGSCAPLVATSGASMTSDAAPFRSSDSTELYTMSMSELLSSAVDL